MLEREVLVGELLAVDGLAARAVAAGEVAALWMRERRERERERSRLRGRVEAKKKKNPRDRSEWK